MKTKVCLDCYSQIIGRSDKKFCGDACRNNYHNNINSEKSEMIRYINNSLKRNRKILKTLINSEQGKANAFAHKLISKGFNFDYFTHVLNTKAGNTYYFCYDYGYRKIDKDYYLLVRKVI
jgi:hypothetical protein